MRRAVAVSRARTIVLRPPVNCGPPGTRTRFAPRGTTQAAKQARDQVEHKPGDGDFGAGSRHAHECLVNVRGGALLPAGFP